MVTMLINKDVDMSSTVPVEEGQEQDYYNKVLKDINSSLEKHRKSSVRSKERVDSRPSLSSQRIDSSSNIDGSTQSSTKPTLEHSPSTGALKKSSSRVTLNSRSVNSAENDSSRKQEPHHHHVNYNADEKNTDLDTIFSLKPNRLIRISPPRPDISDAKATNHYPHYRNPEEQV